jgi:hypothetical protein
MWLERCRSRGTLMIDQQHREQLLLTDSSCSQFLNTYLQYPPPKYQTPSPATISPLDCDLPLIWLLAQEAINPGFVCMQFLFSQKDKHRQYFLALERVTPC